MSIVITLSPELETLLPQIKKQIAKSIHGCIVILFAKFLQFCSLTLFKFHGRHHK